MNNACIKKIGLEISFLSCKDNILSFLVYGSVLNKKYTNDTDIIVIVKDIKKDLTELFKYIFLHFKNPDFHIYSLEEIDHDISFYTREYVMEYLAKATCLFGKNFFKEKFERISNFQYRNSILVRTIEHIQKVRKIFFCPEYSNEYKNTYINKYSFRVAKNILLFKGIESYDSLNKKTRGEIVEILLHQKMLKNYPRKYHILQNKFNFFCDIASNIFYCRKELYSRPILNRDRIKSYAVLV